MLELDHLIEYILSLCNGQRKKACDDGLPAECWGVLIDTSGQFAESRCLRGVSSPTTDIRVTPVVSVQRQVSIVSVASLRKRKPKLAAEMNRNSWTLALRGMALPQ